MGLLERIASLGNLYQAWDSVRARHGGPGIDRVRVPDYAQGVDDRLTRLAGRLREGSYRPAPVLRHYPPDDPARPLSIPTLEDRIVQRAVAGVLGPLLEPTFSPAAWAYRPGRSVDAALRVVERHLDAGLRFYLRTDIEKFFDRIDQARLHAMLAQELTDPRVVALVDRLVRAQVCEGAAADLLEQGVPQGSALSPLLSNVYLRTLDQHILAAGYPLVRYADDMLVLCRTYEQTAEALDLLSREVEALGLRLGPKKTRRGSLGDGFVFLGFHYGPGGRGPAKHAVTALVRRAEALCDGPEDGPAPAPEQAAASLRELVSRWAEFHGALRPEQILSLPLLLGCLLQPALSPERQTELGSRRRSLAAQPVPSRTWLHLALLEAWAAGSQDAALLVEAAAAQASCGRRVLPEVRARLLAALAIPEAVAPELLDALAHPPVGLAAALGRAGRSELARLVREGLFEADGDRREQAATASGTAGTAPDRTPVAPPGAPLITEALLRRLGALFVGREVNHVAQLPDHRGHCRGFTVDRPLGPHHWQDHLSGRRHLGLYLVRTDSTVQVAALTCSVARAARADPGLAASLPGQVADVATRLRRAAADLGLSSLLEERGSFEQRVWLLFQAPVPLRDARALLVRLQTAAEPILPPVRCTRTPEGDRLHAAPGPWLLLPLARLGPERWARFLDEHGQPVADPAAWLSAFRPIRPGQLQDLVRRGPLAADRAMAQGEPIEALLRELPRILRIAAHCQVLRALVDKARELGHLDGAEVCTLFEFLGHVPTEGGEALVRILERTGQADEREVRRRLERLPPSPISCVRIRSRLSSLTARVGCDCRFAGLQPGAYPTPLLHTFRCEEVAGFSAGRSRPGTARTGGGAPPRPPQHATAPTAPRSPATDRARPEQPAPGGPSSSSPPRPAPSAPTRGLTAPPPAASPPPASLSASPLPSPPPAVPAKQAPPRSPLQQQVAYHGQLRQQQIGVNQALQRCENELLATLVRQGVDRLEVDGTLLERIPAGPQRWRIRIRHPAPRGSDRGAQGGKRD